jgi:hypothetical protein
MRLYACMHARIVGAGTFNDLGLCYAMRCAFICVCMHVCMYACSNSGSGYIQ